MRLGAILRTKFQGFRQEADRPGALGIPLLVVLAFAYFVLAKFGLYLATLNHSVSPVWPATGFAFAIAYRFGFRALVAVALGAFAANFLTDVPLSAVVMISLGNTLEAFLGAAIIRRVRAYRKELSYQTDPIAFFLAATLGSAVSASVGSLALLIFRVVPSDALAAVWLTWWVGDTLGGLVVAPLLIRAKGFDFTRIHWIDISATLGLTALSAYFVFGTTFGSSFLFVLFPGLLYAARSRHSDSTLVASFMVTVVSVVATVSGFGPFAMGSLNERLVHLQLFLGAYAITAMMLSCLGPSYLSRFSMTVLVGCWIMAGTIFYSFDQSERRQTAIHFTTLIENAQEKMSIAMRSYADALRGGAGLYSASQSVELQEWRSYYQTVRVDEQYHGINGLGVIWPVGHCDLPQFERHIRAEGLTNFHVRPYPGSPPFSSAVNRTHYVIKFIEPMNRNFEAIGLDIASEQNRRGAAEMARDTGLPTMTSKITLVQVAGNRAGFLFYLPIYRNMSSGPNLNPSPLASVVDRRRSHIGWIYAPVMYRKFFEAALSTSNGELELRAFDDDGKTDQEKIYDTLTESRSEHDDHHTEIQLGQRKIFLDWRKSQRFVSSHNTIVAWVGFCGALASLLFTSLFVSLQLVGQRSRELAGELTKELLSSREKFREGERRLLYALDGSEDGVWDWNMITSEMYVSANMAETYGWPQQSTIRVIRDLSGFAHPEDLEKIHTSLRDHIEGRADSHEVETRYRTKSGRWNWVLTRGKISERDALGRPLRMTGMHIDIDARKRAQELLESTQYQLRNIANSVPSLVSQWSHEMHCEFANDAFADWFGVDPLRIIGTSMHSLLGADDFEDRRAVFEKVLGGQRLQYERAVVRRLDGQTRHVIATYLPNDLEGITSGFFLFIQDITDLKAAELTALEERKTAVAATNIKSQFLANMSHEIRTPINGIIGMTGLLQSTDLTREQREYADVLGRSSEALLNLINDILDFSKVEAGKLDLEIIDFNLAELLSDMQRSFSFSARAKNVSLQFDASLGAQTHFKGDPGRLRQVLTNLMGNAIKFTEKGEVVVRVRSHSLTANCTRMSFEVVDSGIGISEAALSRMFQAFSQEDSSTSRRFGGTGLGLSISKELVQLMGGHIGVRSIAGQGSTFWFDLTFVHGVERQDSVDPETEIQTTAGARILIAEDNRANQQVVLELLKRRGYSAHAVFNGLEVLEALRESQYDLILMDCRMPEMDGYEATARIRENPSDDWKSIPIVAMTAETPDDGRDRCLAAGFNDYAAKPIKERELLKLIETWLRRLDHALPAVEPRISSPVKVATASKGHILIVDDNVVNQTVVRFNLQKLSYTFDIASNGLEALEFVKRNSYDMVLMDCQMPEMDGYEATRQIRASKSAKVADLPVIALTANAMVGDREKCLAAGMNDFLAKPINAKDLAKMVEKWTSRSQAA